ncbi:MAG: hypothetical protein ACKV2Q_23395 [Planctomycetaceae bacterium]
MTPNRNGFDIAWFFVIGEIVTRAANIADTGRSTGYEAVVADAICHLPSANCGFPLFDSF